MFYLGTFPATISLELLLPLTQQVPGFDTQQPELLCNPANPIGPRVLLGQQVLPGLSSRAMMRPAWHTDSWPQTIDILCRLSRLHLLLSLPQHIGTEAQASQQGTPGVATATIGH